MPVTSGGGIGSFFAALSGGPAMRQNAERKGRLAAYEEMLGEASAQAKRQEAIRSLGENEGLRGLRTSAPKIFGEDLGAAIADAAQGKYNLGEATKASGDLQHQLMERNARDALLRGDYSGGNANLAAIDGKPLATTSLADGTTYNQYGDPSQHTYTTQVGQADIAQKLAAATENRAQAGLANVRAEDIRNGGTGEGGGSGGRGGKGGGLNIDGTVLDVLKTPRLDANGKPITNPLTGAPDLGLDPANLAAFFKFAQEREARGGKGGLDGAVMDWMVSQHGGPPEPKFLDPGSWQNAPAGAPEGALVRDKRTGQTFRVIRGKLAPE